MVLHDSKISAEWGVHLLLKTERNVMLNKKWGRRTWGLTLSQADQFLEREHMKLEDLEMSFLKSVLGHSTENLCMYTYTWLKVKTLDPEDPSIVQ